jgi:hypothetical protein
MFATISRNTGKRRNADPWLAGYSTAWQPGESSVIEQTADKFLETDYEDAVVNFGVLFDHKQGNPPKIFNRNDSLRIALRSAYSPYKDKWTDYDKILKLIRSAEDPEGDATRYFLNIPRAGAAQWVYPAEVVAILGDVSPEPGESICLGFDGSQSDDHTCLFGCRENGDLFCIGAWAPTITDIHWRNDVNDVVNWTFEHFTVVRFYGDPPFWQEEMSTWARDHGSPPVTPFWTNQETKMAVATGALRTAIRKEDPDERVTIDPIPIRTPELRVFGNEEVRETEEGGITLVQFHFQNARTRKVKVKWDDRTEEAYIVRKDKPGSPMKIDSVPSAVLAYRARNDAVKEDEFREPVYGRAAFNRSI